MSDRIEVFEQMLASDPDNTMVLFGLANEYQKLQDWEKTIETLERYLKFETDEGAAYGILAKALEATNQSEKAKTTYKKGIEVSIANGHPTMAEEYRQTLEFDYPD